MTFDNAKDLLDEAKCLQVLGKYSRAYALSVLAFEELAKCFSFRCISVGLLKEDDIRRYATYHEPKLKHSMIILAFAYMLNHADEIKEAITHDKGTTHENHIFPDVLSRLFSNSLGLSVDLLKNAHQEKMDAIYVDIRKGKIIDPKTNINEMKAYDMLHAVGILVRYMDQSLSMDDKEFKRVFGDDLFRRMTRINIE